MQAQVVLVQIRLNQQGQQLHFAQTDLPRQVPDFLAGIQRQTELAPPTQMERHTVLQQT
jgi:hypothetical protein